MLNRDQLAFVKLRLDQTCNEIDQSLNDIDQKLKEPPDSGLDEADCASYASEVSALLLEQKRLQTKQKSYSNARAILTHSPEQFGVCIGCDSIIDFERLKRMPNAQRCITCQEIEEVQQNHRRKA